MTSEPPARSGSAPERISYYRLGRVLGSGGMGVVYEATDTRNGTRVALKLVHAHLETDDAYRDRFIREAHVASLLRSPYTVHLLDYGVDEGRYYLVMRLVRGGQTVRDLLLTDPSPAQALRIAGQIARALEEAQTRGVVHRDLKPENIMLDPDGTALLTDFGIARQTGSVTITATGSFIGTPAYAAPEVAEGRADHRSDIYSLGVTLYHMLTGRLPFEGGPLELLRQHADAPMPREPLAEQPQEVVALLAGCLEKDPADRYQSATPLAGVLEHLARAAGEPSEVEAAPPTAEVTAPTERAVPAASADRGATLTLDLRAQDVSARFIPRRQSAHYDLVLHNDGEESLELRLDAGDEEQDCVFTLPDRVSVAPQEQATVALEVSPRRRRWWGESKTLRFSVDVSDGGDGPPLNVAGRLEDTPGAWLPYAGGALFSVALLAIAVALVFGRGGEKQGSAASPDQAPTAAAAAATAASEVTATSTATLTPSPSTTSTASTATPAQSSTPAVGGATLTYGSLFSGTISPAPKKDVYSFPAAAGTEILVTITRSSGELEPEFSILGLDGSSLCSSRSSRIVTESCFVESSGAYTIRIGDWGEDNIGSYDAFLQVISEPSSGTIPFATIVEGSISPAPKKDIYSFAATAGTEISVTLTRTAGELEPEFSVHGPDDKVLCSGRSSRIVTQSCFPDISADYTIRIGDWGEDDTGSYEVFLQAFD